MDLIGDFIFTVGSVICHQRPERSFFIDGHQLPVCARCTGLYVSAVVGCIAWLAWKAARVVQLAPGGTCTADVQVPPGGGCTIVGCTIDAGVARRALLLAAIPTVLSIVSGMLGLWDGSNVTRAVLALPLGATAGAIVAAVAAKDLR
jgi:uncharacterized membrane protein